MIHCHCASHSNELKIHHKWVRACLDGWPQFYLFILPVKIQGPTRAKINFERLFLEWNNLLIITVRSHKLLQPALGIGCVKCSVRKSLLCSVNVLATKYPSAGANSSRSEFFLWMGSTHFLDRNYHQGKLFVSHKAKSCQHERFNEKIVLICTFWSLARPSRQMITHFSNAPLS